MKKKKFFHLSVGIFYFTFTKNKGFPWFSHTLNLQRYPVHGSVDYYLHKFLATNKANIVYEIIHQVLFN